MQILIDISLMSTGGNHHGQGVITNGNTSVLCVNFRQHVHGNFVTSPWLKRFLATFLKTPYSYNAIC